MVKILSQSGRSISDLYDVEGSIVGIKQLESREITLVHEMSGTLFSERCSAAVRRVQTAAIAQNVNFDSVLTDLPSGMWRVLGVLVLANQQTRVASVQLSLRDPLDGREMPFFVWDNNNDVETNIRIVENDAASANVTALRQASPTGIPTLGVGAGQPARVNEIAFRGSSSAFGAGTVTLTALIHIAFSQQGGLSSRGLPLPGW